MVSIIKTRHKRLCRTEIHKQRVMGTQINSQKDKQRFLRRYVDVIDKNKHEEVGVNLQLKTQANRPLSESLGVGNRAFITSMWLFARHAND